MIVRGFARLLERADRHGLMGVAIFATLAVTLAIAVAIYWLLGAPIWVALALVHFDGRLYQIQQRIGGTS